MTEAKILIVEDESIIAMDIRLRLLRFGYTVCGIVVVGSASWPPGVPSGTTRDRDVFSILDHWAL